MRDHLGGGSIFDLLEERTLALGERTFLVFEGRGETVATWSYQTFFDQVQRCAQGLSELGVGRGDFVLVHLANRPEFLLTWFALGKLGAVLVPSNVANTAPEIQHLVQVASPVVAICEARFYDVVSQGVSASTSGVELVVVGDVVLGARNFDELLIATGDSPRPAVTGDALNELIFTSGTSSKPKAVMLTHANCLQAGLQAVHSLWLTEGERCLTALPLFHVNAQAMSVLAALTVGGSVVLVEEFRASRFWGQVRRHEATQTCLVAMQLRTLLAQPAHDEDRLHQIRRLFFAINVSDVERETFEARFNVTLINGYGCSEAMTLLTCSPILGSRRWPSIGRPAVGRRIFLLKEDGTEAAVGEIGEVVVQGTPGRDLMVGYYGDPTETAASLRGELFFTGDNAYSDDAGFLYFVDRKKNMIKRAGENISAAEVEAVLVEHDAVLEACVVGVPDDIRDESVVAVAVVESSSDVTREQLIEHCRAHLSKFKVPSEVIFMKELPKTSIGKIQRDTLLKSVLEQLSEGVSRG